MLARQVQLRSRQLRIYWWICWCPSQFDPIRCHPASPQVCQVCQLGCQTRRERQMAHRSQHPNCQARLNPIHQARHRSGRCSSVVLRCLRNHWWDPGRSCGCGPTRRSVPRTRWPRRHYPGWPARYTPWARKSGSKSPSPETCHTRLPLTNSHRCRPGSPRSGPWLPASFASPPGLSSSQSP